MSAREEIETNRLLGSLVDSEFEKLVDEEGESRVQDFASNLLLNKILKQLKIMNFHLSIITDNEIQNKDI